MQFIQDIRYRKDIDGLRAVAVLSVVLYHAGFGFTGGYVGVDVFFVISGYLISGLIWNRLESGRFTFSDFWERRVRRLVPALVVVTVAVQVAGCFFLLAADYKKLGWASASQAVFSANFWYWLDSGYFAGGAAEKPLLHTWSLAVEEQFYLFVPFILFGLFWGRYSRSRAVILLLIVVGGLISLCWSIHEVAHNRDAAFYLLPARAWELLCGSLVAFLPSSLLPRGRFLREVFAAAGLFCILFAVFIYTPKTPFPGLAALLPCLGAALLIWANSPGNELSQTITARLLSFPPLVFFGLISYSLYLWHWPFLAFGHYTTLIPLSPRDRFIAVCCGFVCAVLSWWLIETPFRTRKIMAGRRSIFYFGGASMAVVFLFGWLCVVFEGFPTRLSHKTQQFAKAQFDSDFLPDLTAEDVREGKLVPLGESSSKFPPVLIWGDSHAKSMLPALDIVFREKKLAGLAATHSSTAPVLNWVGNDVPEFSNKEEFNTAVLEFIKEHHIKEVILIARWSAYVNKPLASDARSPGPFDAALLQTAQKLVQMGCHPSIILDVPSHIFDVPRALARSFYRRAYLDSLRSKVESTNQLDFLATSTVDKLRDDGIPILDPKPYFVDKTGRYYIIQEGKIVLYCDYDHLTREGAKLMLPPFLRAYLSLPSASLD